MNGVIYKIINKVNGKFYLGSSTQFDRRKKTHLWKLTKGIHHSIYLQNAFNKYGVEAFEFHILYESEDIKADEQKELDSLDWAMVYNVARTSTGGDRNKYHPDRDAIYEKISVARKNCLIKPNNRVKIQVSGICFPSYADAKKYLNIPIVTIRYRCMSNNIKYVDWFIIGKDKTVVGSYVQGANRGCKILCDGVEYSSYAEASRSYNMSITAISNRVTSENFPTFILLKE
jgi:hypothetical protein